MHSVMERHYSQRSSNPYKGVERPLGLEEVEALRVFRQSLREQGYQPYAPAACTPTNPPPPKRLS
jgi:hypothetical protein